MITNVTIKNFRSIEDIMLNLGKITVLTGANNSGKSSVIYALMVLKNAITNPNQTRDNLFNLGFINLGGFKESVYRKNLDKAIILKITIGGKHPVGYELGLATNFLDADINIHVPSLQLKAGIDVDFPYKADQNVSLKSPELPEHKLIFWNGLIATTVQNSEFEGKAKSGDFGKLYELEAAVNLPVKTISSIDLIPIRRGFTKPFFSPVPLTTQITNEEEVATLLYADRELVSAVAHHLEKIVDRQFSVNPVPNTTNFYLQTRDRTTGFTADLVNEGLGTNQLVTILAKALYKNTAFICIDEPEIHLHPTIIDKLVDVLIEIANDKKKQFLISTHSEHFINALLSAVVKKTIAPEDVKVYHLTKDGWDTKVEEQKINADGQIEGGLAQFYAAELANWSTFFKIDEQQ